MYSAGHKYRWLIVLVAPVVSWCLQHRTNNFQWNFREAMPCMLTPFPKAQNNTHPQNMVCFWRKILQRRKESSEMRGKSTMARMKMDYEFQKTSKRWSNFCSSDTGKTGPIPQFGRFISRIFPYHGKHFHTTELDKTMEIGFSNLFLQYFQNISILWKCDFFKIL